MECLLTIRRSLADMTLDLPGTFFFQIFGMAPGIVLLAALFTWTCLSKRSAAKLISPLGLKFALSVRTNAFNFCISKALFCLCKEIPSFGLQMLLQSWTTQRQEDIFARWNFFLSPSARDKVTSQATSVDLDPISPLLLGHFLFR